MSRAHAELTEWLSCPDAAEMWNHEVWRARLLTVSITLAVGKVSPVQYSVRCHASWENVNK